jgi:hypothetical protein
MHPGMHIHIHVSGSHGFVSNKLSYIISSNLPSFVPHPARAFSNEKVYITPNL